MALWSPAALALYISRSRAGRPLRWASKYLSTASSKRETASKLAPPKAEIPLGPTAH